MHKRLITEADMERQLGELTIQETELRRDLADKSI
jgi:hypothetical protein